VEHIPETETNSIYLAQLSRFLLKTETESSLRNVVVLNKTTMDTVQNCDSYERIIVVSLYFELNVMRQDKR
jgi:hypothetical protein